MKPPEQGSRRYRKFGSRAAERSTARKLTWMRLTRTIVLGTVAAIAAIIYLGRQYGVDTDVILDFLTASAVFVGVLVVMGFCGTVILFLAKKLMGRSD